MPENAQVVIASADGPTTSWPSRTMAGQTFALIDAAGYAPTWPRRGVTVGDRELPGIFVPSATDRVIAKAKDSAKGDGKPEVMVIAHDYLSGNDIDDPSYLGVGARAMVLVHLGAQRSPSIDDLGMALPRTDNRLYVQAHRAGRFGFLRFTLVVGGLSYDLDTGVSPVDGNIQEFLAVAHQTEAVELHLSRAPDTETVLCCSCTATGIRAVIDRALAELAAAEHPGSAAEWDEFTAALPPALAGVNDSLDSAASVSLTVTGNMPSFLALEVVAGDR